MTHVDDSISRSRMIGQSYIFFLTKFRSLPSTFFASSSIYWLFIFFTSTTPGFPRFSYYFFSSFSSPRFICPFHIPHVQFYMAQLKPKKKRIGPWERRKQAISMHIYITIGICMKLLKWQTWCRRWTARALFESRSRLAFLLSHIYKVFFFFIYSLVYNDLGVIFFVCHHFNLIVLSLSVSLSLPFFEFVSCFLPLSLSFFPWLCLSFSLHSFLYPISSAQPSIHLSSCFVSIALLFVVVGFVVIVISPSLSVG